MGAAQMPRLTSCFRATPELFEVSQHVPFFVSMTMSPFLEHESCSTSNPLTQFDGPKQCSLRRCCAGSQARGEQANLPAMLACDAGVNLSSTRPSMLHNSRDGLFQPNG